VQQHGLLPWVLVPPEAPRVSCGVRGHS
jgi:hypothetical protein